MSSPMLQLVQQASKEMGLTPPVAVASNPAADVVQLMALLTAAGQEITREFDWQKLVKAYFFETVYYQYTGDTTDGSITITSMSSVAGLTTDFMVTGNGINQDTSLSLVGGASVRLDQAATATATGVDLTFGKVKYGLPSDYECLLNDTQWDKSKHWKMLGPETAQQWQWLKSGYISTGPRIRFRILGGYFTIWPMPTTVDVLGFEYRSNSWVVDGSSYLQAFTADDQTCLYTDRLMILALKKKYFEIKGFDTTALMRDYTRALEIEKANDQGAATLSMAPLPADLLITENNLPDSGYGIQ